MMHKTSAFRLWVKEHRTAFRISKIAKDVARFEKSGSEQNEKMREFSNLLLCPLCNEVFTHPVKLPCSHSMCYGCARSQLLTGIVDPCYTPKEAMEENKKKEIDEVVVKTNDFQNFEINVNPTNTSKGVGITVSGFRRNQIKPEIKLANETRQKKKFQIEALKGNKIRYMSCPKCRQTVELPVNGFHGLVRNLGLERMVARFTDEAKLAVEIKCNFCKPPPKAATKTCYDCQMSYCNNCYKNFHIWGTPRAQHRFAGPRTKLIKPKSLVCYEHRKEKVTGYCTQCREPVCSRCEIKCRGKHHNHPIIQLHKAQEEGKKKLNLTLVDMKAQRENIEEKVQNVCDAYEDADKKYKAAKNNIKVRMTAMEVYVRDRREELISDIDAKMSAQEYIYRNEIEKCHQALCDSNFIEYAEEAMKECQSDFFLQNFADLEDDLEKAFDAMKNVKIGDEENFNFQANVLDEIEPLRKLAEGEINDEYVAKLKEVFEEENKRENLEKSTIHEDYNETQFAEIISESNSLLGSLNNSENDFSSDLTSNTSTVNFDGNYYTVNQSSDEDHLNNSLSTKASSLLMNNIFHDQVDDANELCFSAGSSRQSLMSFALDDVDDDEKKLINETEKVMKKLLSTIEAKERIRKENEQRNQKLLPKFATTGIWDVVTKVNCTVKYHLNKPQTQIQITDRKISNSYTVLQGSRRYISGNTYTWTSDISIYGSSCVYVGVGEEVSIEDRVFLDDLKNTISSKSCLLQISSGGARLLKRRFPENPDMIFPIGTFSCSIYVQVDVDEDDFTVNFYDVTKSPFTKTLKKRHLFAQTQSYKSGLRAIAVSTGDSNINIY